MLQRCRASSNALICAVAIVIAVCGCASSAAGQKLAPPPLLVTDAPAPVSATGISPQEFSRAQAATQKILASAEFQREPPTLWDIIKEKIGEVLVRIFAGIDRVTSASPWMGRALEWLLFIAAAVGLLVWGLRTVQRQRLRVALGGEPLKTAERSREREDWWRLAEVEASKGAWREAIHAVYWAAIVHLENRRAWRHNPARTPREYVRLLKSGSAEQRELRGLTGTLEKSWYGQRPAQEKEYRAARESFERLAADAEKRGGDRESSAVDAGGAGFAGGGA